MANATVSIHHPLVADSQLAEHDLWNFPQGLIGLPDLRRLARLPLESVAPFELLCSPDADNFGIVLVDPHALVLDYHLALEARELLPLTTTDPSRLEIRVSVVLPSEDAPLSLNLKGPIIFSPDESLGIQRVSPDESHPVRFVPDLHDAGAAPCSS